MTDVPIPDHLPPAPPVYAGDRVVIELLALPSPVPMAGRLKQLLKHALRTHRLRCVRAESVPPPGQQTSRAAGG